MGEWTQVNRQRNTPPRWMVDQELQELREEMAWMRSRLSAPSQGSKGKGKGKGQAKPKPKGASQGATPPATATQASSEGPARRRPNLKPNEETATPTLIEIKCQKCQAYNWTSRELCRSCETPLARLPGISSSSTQPLQPVARPLGTTPGKSYADAAAGSPPASQSVLALDKEGLSKRQAELETSHWNLAGRIPSQDGAFHSAGLCQREAEGPQAAGSQARLGDSRGEEGHRQAGKGRRNLETGAGGIGASPPPGDQGYPRTGGCQSCSSSPPPPPDTPPPGSVSLSSDDVAGLISFFQELAEEREAAPGAEPPSKKGRVGPYGETPSLKATKDAAVRAKLERGQAYLGYMLNQSLKSGDGSCQAATQETPSQKGSGKGSGAAPGVGADPPKDPLPPPAPTAEKEKEATQPIQVDEDSAMQDAQAR